MRHSTGNRRQRSRNNGRRNHNGNGGGAPNRSQVFDSNGPDVRIRGTAHQIVEKYQALSKDATSSGDYTLAENYRQHAEHYQRIINDWDEYDRQRQAKRQNEQKQNDQKHNNDQKDGNNNKQKEASNNKDKQQAAKQEGGVKEAVQVEDLGLPASLLPKAPVAAEPEATKEEENA